VTLDSLFKWNVFPPAALRHIGKSIKICFGHSGPVVVREPRVFGKVLWRLRQSLQYIPDSAPSLDCFARWPVSGVNVFSFADNYISESRLSHAIISGVKEFREQSVMAQLHLKFLNKELAPLSSELVNIF
jgi:hypothetical protein